VFWRHKHECIAHVKTWVSLSQNNLQNGVHLFQKDLNLPDTELWFAFRLGETGLLVTLTMFQQVLLPIRGDSYLGVACFLCNCEWGSELPPVEIWFLGKTESHQLFCGLVWCQSKLIGEGQASGIGNLAGISCCNRASTQEGCVQTVGGGDQITLQQI
jgi:hypothetical protein